MGTYFVFLFFLCQGHISKILLETWRLGKFAFDTIIL